MSDIDKFSSILKQGSVSVTKPRIAIFQTLQSLTEPVKSGEIARLTPSVDRASVYRALELFASLGITNTVVRGWTPLTELSEPFRAHHHHITCTNCGKSESIEDPTLEDVLFLIAHRRGYLLKEHNAELTGVCTDCQKLSSI